MTSRKSALLILPAALLPLPALASTTYSLLEKVPGFESASGSDLAAYLVAIYEFGIWTVGIAALLMAVLGGIMHVTSAGNAASMAKAKGIVRDAVAGVLMALAGWLLLHEINPDLTEVRLPDSSQGISGSWTYNYTSMGSASAETGSAASGTGSSGSASSGSGSSSAGSSSSGSSSSNPMDKNAGKCIEVSDGPCTTSNLQQYFGDNAARFSRICDHESGGDANHASTVDITSDGHVFSWGLFQINLTTTDYKIEGMDCKKAFSGINKKAKVVDEDLYNKCVTAIKKVENNVAAAQYMYSKRGWDPWGNNCA